MYSVKASSLYLVSWFFSECLDTMCAGVPNFVEERKFIDLCSETNTKIGVVLLIRKHYNRQLRVL